MSLCFEAAAAGGPLRLVLPKPTFQAPAQQVPQAGQAAQPATPQTHPTDLLDAALALAPAEALLRAVEAWWQTALDPLPSGPGTGLDATEGPCLWLESPTPAALRLGLPWAALLAAAPPPATLPWAWPSLTWRVVLATYPQDPLPAGPVCAGALLLPPSFEGAWRVQLRCAEPALQAEAEWAGPGHALQLCGPPEAASPAEVEAPCWVELCSPWVANVPQLLGWAAPPATPLGDQARWCRPGVEGHPPRLGTVAPALGGAALWFNTRAGNTVEAAPAEDTEARPEAAAWT